MIPRPEWWFFAIGGLCGMLLAILTPPFQNPDEHQHLYRAYALSEFRLTPEGRNGRLIINLPASIPDLAALTLGTSDLRPERALRTQRLVDTLRLGRMRLSPDIRADVEIATAYPPTGYLPQALAVGVGRAVGLGPLWLLLAARLASLSVCLAIVWFALRIMPIGRYVALAIALFPMSLAMFASAAPDGVVIATGLLFLALAQRAVLNRSPREDPAIAAAALSVFGLAKFAYMPLAIAGAASGGRQGLRHVAMAVLLGLILIGWLVFAPSVAPEPGSNIGAQTNVVLGDPLGFLSAGALTLEEHALRYFMEAVGILGLLTVVLPQWAYVFALIATLLSIFAEKPAERLPAYVPLIWILLCGASAALVLLGLYLQWNPVGAHRIAGAQGRYFLPLLPFVLCPLAILGRPSVAVVSLICATAVAASGPLAVFLAYRPL